MYVKTGILLRKENSLYQYGSNFTYPVFEITNLWLTSLEVFITHLGKNLKFGSFIVLPPRYYKYLRNPMN